MKKGKIYEEKIKEFLSSKGCKILTQNYRSPFGEIDLIALCKGKVFVIEVKGSSKNRNPASRVNCKKVLGIYRTLLKFLSENPDLKSFEMLLLTAEVFKSEIKFKRIYLEDCLSEL